MKRQLRFLGAAVVMSLFVMVFAAEANAAAIKDGADTDVSMLRHTGKVFANIAKQATPAVVYISVEKTVEQQGRYYDPFEGFDDEFFERFFGRQFRDRFSRPRQRQPQKRVLKGQGSGFIISSDGYILTNNHVVEDADKVFVKLSDDREFQAEVIGTDQASEVAVIKVDANDLPTVELGDSEKLEVGEWVLAIGNPFGLTHTVTAGIVSAKGRSGFGIADYEDFIQSDAAINPGNSGGPLINIDGQVVGINSAIYSRSGGYMGIGFAIPVNMAKYIYQQIVETGSVVRGFLGITGKTLTADMAQAFSAAGHKGVLVNQVVEDSPAEKAGLKHGDIIIEMDGKAVEEYDKFRRDIAKLPPQTEVKLIVIRDGQKETVVVELAERQADIAQAETAELQLGIKVQNLTEEMAGRLGIEDEKGVVVVEVEQGSDAQRAGIVAGMIIKEVNKEPAENVKQFNRQIKKAQKAGSVLLYVKKDGLSQYIYVKL